MDVGLGLATISMITGVVVGSALVRWAVRNPKVEVMRNAAPTADEDYDVDRIRVAAACHNWRGVGKFLPIMIAPNATLIIRPGRTRQTSMTALGNMPEVPVSLPSTWGPSSSTRNPAMTLDGMYKARSTRIPLRTAQPTANTTPRITIARPIV